MLLSLADASPYVIPGYNNNLPGWYDDLDWDDIQRDIQRDRSTTVHYLSRQTSRQMSNETCLTMEIAERDRNGGHFGVTFFDEKNNTLLEEASQFRPHGDHFKQCFQGIASRMEFSTSDQNGWTGALTLEIDGVRLRVIQDAWFFRK